MINCTIVGRLTADPIVATRHIGDADVKVANFTVAANSGFGERRKTQYFRVALWRGMADFAEKYLMKARLVSCAGSIGLRSYIGTNGTPRTTLEFGSDVRLEVETKNPEGATTVGDAGDVTVEPVDDYVELDEGDKDFPF